MGNRKSAADKLTAEQANSILKYFKNHTFCSTMRKFSLTRSALTILLSKYGVSQHSSSKAEVLKHLEQDGYDNYTERQLAMIYKSYLKLGTVEDACDACEIKEYFLVYLLQSKNIPINHKATLDTAWYDRLSEEKKSQIISYYLIPHTLVDTSAEFNIPAHRIKAILLKANIQLHPKELTEKLGKQKQKQNLCSKYGQNITNVFQLNSVKAKSKLTKKQKYGNESYTNREKASKTCLERFGATSFLGSASGREEIKKYSQEHYGTDFAFLSTAWQNNEEKKAKAAETKRIKKYTAENYSAKYLALSDNLTELAAFVKNKTVYDIATELEISRDHAYYLLYKNNLLDLINKASTKSHYEDEIVDFVGKENCICSDRTVLDGQEIDIYIPSKKIGIEFNGNYWHSSLNIMDKNYHFNKSKLAERKGIRLIHIWEYEWTDQVMQQKIKLMLDIALNKVKNKIYARKCQIKQITNKEASLLNEQVHLQGHRNAQVTYGLFYENKLVQLMSFSKTKYNRNLKDDNSWEIIRGCPGSNNIVVGGVSKLFSHFIREYQPKKIFSYCDFNKFTGKSYEKAGMKFIGYTGPDMKWVINDFRTVINRCPSKHTELKAIANAQIFGAGSKKYLLEL